MTLLKFVLPTQQSHLYRLNKSRNAKKLRLTQCKLNKNGGMLQEYTSNHEEESIARTSSAQTSSSFSIKKRVVEEAVIVNG